MKSFVCRSFVCFCGRSYCTRSSIGWTILENYWSQLQNQLFIYGTWSSKIKERVMVVFLPPTISLHAVARGGHTANNKMLIINDIYELQSFQCSLSITMHEFCEWRLWIDDDWWIHLNYAFLIAKFKSIDSFPSVFVFSIPFYVHCRINLEHT